MITVQTDKDVTFNPAQSIRAASETLLSIGKKSSAPVKKIQNDETSTLLTKTTNKVLAIGASNGGTKALEAVLSFLPGTTPGTVIVQHMPENFTAAFAGRLNEICQMEVREARNHHSGVGKTKR